MCVCVCVCVCVRVCVCVCVCVYANRSGGRRRTDLGSERRGQEREHIPRRRFRHVYEQRVEERAARLERFDAVCDGAPAGKTGALCALHVCATYGAQCAPRRAARSG
jgi:hypothetical protein